jgi:hypothetical protein
LAVDPLAGFNWRELASLACCNAKALNAKELAFAADMFHRNKPPSPKQEAWLRSIAKRFESEVR